MKLIPSEVGAERSAAQVVEALSQLVDPEFCKNSAEFFQNRTW
jgi:metal-sulfur cluster biosynthetic enzyme